MSAPHSKCRSTVPVMSKILYSNWFAFDSAHEKFDVWTGLEEYEMKPNNLFRVVNELRSCRQQHLSPNIEKSFRIKESLSSTLFSCHISYENSFCMNGWVGGAGRFKPRTHHQVFLDNFSLTRSLACLKKATCQRNFIIFFSNTQAN